MMKAAIDIGTNTVLLLVAKITEDQLEVIHEEQRIPRLGRGVDESGNLPDEAERKVIDALREYKDIIRTRFPEVESVYVTATSAVRDAQNKEAFAERVKEETGFRIQILSGLEEAHYTYRGALSALRERAKSGNVVIDIGGGSTEIIIGEGDTINDRHSFDMGCVRFTERFLASDKVSDVEINCCREAIKSTLNQRLFDVPEDSTLIGVAGTVTSLAFMHLGLKNYEARALDGSVISKSVLQQWIADVQSLTSDELLSRYPEVMEGRADIFLAGLLILNEFMKFYNFDEVVVSTGGIRHGAVV